MQRNRHTHAVITVLVTLSLLLTTVAPAVHAQTGGTVFLPLAGGPTTVDNRPLAPDTAAVATVRLADDGAWPRQLVGVTGAVQQSRYGPQRHDPAEGIPDHAYSPFDERNNREHLCPPDGCDAVVGRLLIKFAADVQVRAGEVGAAAVDDADLSAALAAQQIVALEPVFPQATPPAAGEVIAAANGETMLKPDLTRWYRATLADDTIAAADHMRAASSELADVPGIDWVEADYVRKLANLPHVAAGMAPVEGETAVAAASAADFTDPLYAQQWHLAAANVPAAWDYLTGQGLPAGGSRDIVVAVIDTGVDYTHPDLAANMWVNGQETPGNNTDDDGNGFVDDVHGANVVSNQHSGNPADDHGHGTHVAGIIAAQAGNSMGGVGVAHNVQIMAIKAAQYSGVLAASDIAEAVYYAVAQGADVINMSFGGYARSQVEEDALAVAFGQAVLVAAAGNDGLVNLPCPFGRDMYPAAYNWVLGVMASTNSGQRAGFSNHDCTPRDTHEYELLAPGVDVWSTLPFDQYAAWDGTSMATPVVAGIAALARTVWSDKDIYSSRFIMGQIAANAGPVADAHAALTVAPQPRLSYLQHWLFDTTAQGVQNDNDGIVDAGETVELAVVIRNHWGKADPVNVVLEPWAQSAVQPDPYVTMEVDTVNYGAIGSFNQDDNGLIYDEEGVITGVAHPFRFTVSLDTPNDHVIPLRLTMSAGNGYDAGDPGAPYVSTSFFYLVVQRGRVLPRIIDSDMVLTKDFFWIAGGQTLIDTGTTLTITEGTQVQWGSPDPNNPYSEGLNAYLQVPGTLSVRGTFSEPVELFTSEVNQATSGYVSIQTSGSTDISYANIRNPRIGTGTYAQATRLSHTFLDGERSGSISSQYLENSIVHKIPNMEHDIQSHHIWTSLLDSLNGDWGGLTIGYYGTETISDTVFLQDNQKDAATSLTLKTAYFDSESAAQGTPHSGNAFLSKYWEGDVSRWMRVQPYYQYGRDRFLGVTRNYWGTLSLTLIENAIFDFNDDFNKARVVYEPILTSPLTSTFPFVVDILLSTDAFADQSALHGPNPIIGAEPVTFKVTFNRDMDPAVQPAVSFGPDVPLTDYTIHAVKGGWQDARTWVGAFNVTPVTGDGLQLIRVAGAVAADDPWLVTGDDAGRFRFEVITSGTEAMNLQATGGEGFVDLAWTQDDFDLLAGYNLYRATSAGGTYTRINQGLIPAEQRAFQDTAVTPGQPYFYKFTVIKTDMSESDFSNVAGATPVDTVPPAISHTPLTTAQPGLALTIAADVTDNVAVQSATLRYRALGGSTYSSLAMVRTTGNRYTATIPGSAVAAPGVEYYLEASDGITTVKHGRPELPHVVSVVDQPVVNTITPVQGGTAGGDFVTISGSNFKPGTSVTFGGAVASNVNVLSANQLTCTTPARFPGTVDVQVANPGGGTAALLQSFTYLGDTVSLALPDTGGGQGTSVQIPINVAGVNGLVAAELTVTFDPTVLTGVSAAVGNLTPGWSLTYNTNTPGRIVLALISPAGPVSGDGVLAYLNVDVVGAPGANSALHVSNALFNDGDLGVDAQDGAFTVDQVHSVSGQIQFWNGGGIPDVTTTLDGDRLYSALSAADGQYTVGGAANGAYVLTPSKADDVDGISAYDASLVLQHTVGLNTLSGHAATAGDVNRSGAINSMDAYYILQKAVDLVTLPFPGAGAVWGFDPATRNIASLSADLSNQNFTGVLYGDVSGNWSPPAAAAQASQGAPGVTLASVTGGEVGQARYVIELDPADVAAYSIELDLRYAADLGAVDAVDTGDAAADWLLSANLSEGGRIRIAMAGAAPITSAGAVIALTFDADDPAALDLQVMSGMVNETELAIQAPTTPETPTEPENPGEPDDEPKATHDTVFLPVVQP